MENAENESLQRMLRQHLHGKRFLIVFDNMGTIPYFKSIFKALPLEDKESRLLFTSRSISARYFLPEPENISTLHMDPLDDNRSWEMFLNLLLLGNQKLPKALEKKGREMLRMCAGLPLSIKEMATQYVIKRQDGCEWEELLESVDLRGTLAVLETVYHLWPPQLKMDFLCMSFFKKDTTIRTEKLVQVWTAGQVIPLEEIFGDLSLELQFSNSKVALLMKGFERYIRTFIRLMNEYIIVDPQLSKKGSIKCIRINASFHTLSVAKAEEEMVFETIKKGESNPPSSSQEPCHRAIYCSREEFNPFIDHEERLVSLFFRGGGYFDASEAYWKRFKQLRTLDFESFGLKFLPKAIGTLTELRYLGLRDNCIKELPWSLERLKNLEVLDIALNFMVEVSNIVWDMGSLRYLYMSDIICQKPLKIDTLRNLEILTYISVENWTYEVSGLRMMTSLRKLGIEEVDENSDVSNLFASLAYLRNLDCLILRGFRFRSLPPFHGLETLEHLTELRLDGLLTKLPTADIFPPSITHLSLFNSSLDEDPMPELGKLKTLEYLKLKYAYTGQRMVIPPDRCNFLKVLCIEELWHLRSIQVENYRHTFGLEKLEIKSCPYLEDIPEHIFGTGTENRMKMITTRKLAAKIRKSDVISKTEYVDIQP